jgi:hypothetical protein
MAPTAGYNTTLYVGGTPTTMTNEPTTEVSAGPPQVFRITDTTKRAIDPATAVVIRDQDTTDVTSDFTIDFNTGTVTSATGGYDSVTVSGKFTPLLAVALGRSASAEPMAAELDTSPFGQSHASSIQGKRSASGEIVVIAPLGEDLDTGGGTRSWQARFDNASQALIDVRMTSTSAIRAWAIIPSLTSKTDQAGLVEGSIRWRSISIRSVTQNTECGFSVFDPTA